MTSEHKPLPYNVSYPLISLALHISSSSSKKWTYNLNCWTLHAINIKLITFLFLKYLYPLPQYFKFEELYKFYCSSAHLFILINAEICFSLFVINSQKTSSWIRHRVPSPPLLRVDQSLPQTVFLCFFLGSRPKPGTNGSEQCTKRSKLLSLLHISRAKFSHIFLSRLNILFGIFNSMGWGLEPGFFIHAMPWDAIKQFGPKSEL